LNVLFDLDGTLTDPRDGIVRSVLYALERMGREREDGPDLDWLIGPPIQKSFPILLGTEDASEVARAVGFFRERFSEVGLFENAVYEGIPLALSSLDGPLFVATSKPVVFAERVLRHFELDGFFAGVYGSELDGTRTAKADVIGHLLACEGLSAEECVMVGDREHDAIGARAHGMRCIGVLYGYGSREELLAAGVSGLCGSPGELVGVLARFGA